VILLDFDGVMTKAWITEKVEAIKIALNQESIAYQKENINSELL